MAIEIGTAAGHGDLMRKLHAFLSAEWDVMRWVPAAPLAGQPYLSSSQYDGTTPPSEAFNGVVSGDDGWRTFSGLHVPSWIRVQFDDKTEVVEIKVRSWATNPTRAPMDFALQYSDDDTAWTTHASYTGQTAWGANEVRTFTAPGGQSHAYWRLYITANNGDANYTEINEIEMRDTVGGTNLALSSLIPELIVRGPGLSSSDEIFVGMQRYASSTSDWFNWRIRSFIGYVPENTFAMQPGASSPRAIALWDQSIPYWFVRNGRRFIVVAKISTVYEALYGGFILPYATPAQFPYPIMVGGTLASDSGTRWSDTSAGHSAFAFSPASLALRNVVGSHISPDLWPSTMASGATLYNYRPAPGDSYPLFPIELEDGGPNRYGYMHGVYFVPGYAAAVEDVINISGTDYLMVQNVFRNGVRNYFAVRLS
jgi:hypothetical protein